jgi:mono/diheme cytochrome c family protein
MGGTSFHDIMHRITTSPTAIRSLRIGAALSFVLVIASCASLEVAAPPVEKLTLPKNADRAKLAEGRQILASRCVKCHGAPQVAKHSVADWKEDILPTMTKKAKLTDQEAALLKNYVLTAHDALTANRAFLTARGLQAGSLWHLHFCLAPQP